MANKRAQILTDSQFKQALAFAQKRALPQRARVMLLLSFKAGLRAQEIAGLTWDAVTDANNRIGKPLAGVRPKKGEQDVRFLFVGGHIGKYGRERTLVMHSDLKQALEDLREFYGRVRLTDPVVRSITGRPMKPDNVRKWFERFYDAAGFNACTSHSGRRTLITKLSRTANNFECSLRDVQEVAGHASIRTTESYIEPTRNLARMMESV